MAYAPGPFPNHSPKPFGNNNVTPKSNYGSIPNFQRIGFAPGTAPVVVKTTTLAPFGNPKEELNKIPSIFKLTS